MLGRVLPVAVAAAALTITLAGCERTPNATRTHTAKQTETWVIDGGVNYTGERGGRGEYYVPCVRPGDTTGAYKEIHAPRWRADDDDLNQDGAPCPRELLREESSR